MNWIYDYQILIAGFLAVVAAFIGARALYVSSNKQITEIAKRKKDEQFSLATGIRVELQRSRNLLEKLTNDPEGVLNGYYYLGIDFEGFPKAIYDASHARVGELGPDLADAVSVAHQALDPLRPKFAEIVAHWDPLDPNPSNHELPEEAEALIKYALKSVIDAVDTFDGIWLEVG